MNQVTGSGGGWVVVTALLAGLLLGAAIRNGILHDEAQALLCRGGGANGWCDLRSALGWSIHYQLFGLGGLFLGILGWVTKWRGLALAGLLVGACGLLVYNATYAAVATVIALLAALRPVESVK